MALQTGALKELFKDGSIGRQLLVWGVLNQLVSQLLQPVTQQLLDEIYPVLPSTPIPPATAADMVVRGVIEPGAGADEAKHSGLNADKFAQMVHATGDPLSIGQLLEAFRRGLLPDDAGRGGAPSLMEGIRQSRLKDMWAGTLKELQWLPLPVADAVEAVVKGQIDYPTGLKYSEHNGVREPEFGHLVDAAGNPPSPGELLELHKRGFIPLEGTGAKELTVQQGMYEGRTKDKWWSMLAKLGEYVPPPRTISALVREGALTAEQAQKYYQQNGLTPELAGIYTAAASHTKLAKPRELAESQVLELYEAHVLTADEATQFLKALGYGAHEVNWLIALKDMHRALSAMEKAVTKIHALYVARKISKTDTSAALDALEIPTEQRDHMLASWDVERNATVRVLTEAQIVTAFGNSIIDQGSATTYLTDLGYSEFDAWVLLSNHGKAPLGEPPAAGRNVPGRAQ